MNEQSNQLSSEDTNKLKNLNRWMIVLLVFIIVWSIGILFVFNKPTTTSADTTPIALIDNYFGKINNNNRINLVHQKSSTNNIYRAMYEQKTSYELMDFVVINYFFIEGLITEKHGNDYVVMYKDHNRVLRTITVPTELLLVPTSYNVVNPFSLLSD